MTKTTSDEYAELLAQAHGTVWEQTRAWHPVRHEIASLIREQDINTALDFGGAAGNLGKWLEEQPDLDIAVDTYDAGMPERSKYPEVAYELVMSTDVLEHVEPEWLDCVLDQIGESASRFQYHRIATAKSGALLADGRDAHLIVQDHHWWAVKLERNGWHIIWEDQEVGRSRFVLTKCEVSVNDEGFRKWHRNARQVLRRIMKA
jgi:hypothetical protein